MRYKFLIIEIIKVIVTCLLAILLLVILYQMKQYENNKAGQVESYNTKADKETVSYNFVVYLQEPISTKVNSVSEDVVSIQEETRLGEMELVAQMIQAEAGNQDLKGKRLVADVIYNRLDSEWADDVEGVIFQELNGIPQFSSIADGNFNRAGWNISEESFIAARLEYDSKYRLDNDVLYFCAGHYNPFGTPGYKYQDHYFSYE